MILSNTAIFEALDDGRLEIDPAPAPRNNEPGGPESPFGTTAVDLTLSKYLEIPEEDLQINIDLRQGGNFVRTLSHLSATHEIDPEQGYRLKPKQFVLAKTAERVRLLLPADFPESARGKPVIAARVEGKSSRARLGLLVHFTAPTIHAGWDGPITLEMMCLGTVPIVLYPGMPICQLIFEHVFGEPSESKSQFHGQVMPSGTKS